MIKWHKVDPVRSSPYITDDKQYCIRKNGRNWEVGKQVQDQFGNYYDFNEANVFTRLKDAKAWVEQMCNEKLRVCYKCLLGIESHEGHHMTIKIFIEDDDHETRCDWCEETADEGGFDTLYELQ